MGPLHERSGRRCKASRGGQGRGHSDSRAARNSATTGMKPEGQVSGAASEGVIAGAGAGRGRATAAHHASLSAQREVAAELGGSILRRPALIALRPWCGQLEAVPLTRAQVWERSRAARIAWVSGAARPGRADQQRPGPVAAARVLVVVPTWEEAALEFL